MVNISDIEGAELVLETLSAVSLLILQALGSQILFCQEIWYLNGLKNCLSIRNSLLKIIRNLRNE